MFVNRAKYDALRQAHAVLESRHEGLIQRWNKLVERINAKGGEKFLSMDPAMAQKPQFSSEDIRRLIMLCHPDKHNGSKMAEEMTQKLLRERA